MAELRSKCSGDDQTVSSTPAQNDAMQKPKRTESSRSLSELISCAQLERSENRRVIRYRTLYTLKGTVIPLLISTVRGRGDSCTHPARVGSRYVVFATSNIVHLRDCAGHRRVEDRESAFVKKVAELVWKHEN